MGSWRATTLGDEAASRVSCERRRVSLLAVSCACMADCVTSIDVRSDGGVLAIGRGGGSLQLWDLQAGRVVAQRLERAESPVMAVRFSPDGTLLAALSEDGTLTLWDGVSFAPIERVEAEPEGAFALAFDHDSALLATVGAAGHVHVWDARTGALEWCATDEHPDGAAHAVTFRADGLVVGFESGILATWRKNPEEGAGQPLYVQPGGLEAFSSQVVALDSHPSSKLVAAGGNDGAGVLLFHAADWRCVARIAVPRPLAVHAVALSTGGAWVAAACSDGVVRVAELGGYAQAVKLLSDQALGGWAQRDGTPEGVASSVAFLSTDAIVSGHFDGAVRFWRRKGAAGSFSHVGSLRLSEGDPRITRGEDQAERACPWGELVGR